MDHPALRVRDSADSSLYDVRWADGQAHHRIPRRLSREAIVSCALTLADQEGLEAVTIDPVGGALGLAVITTLATSHVESLVAGGAPPLAGLVGGFQRGLLVAGLVGGFQRGLLVAAVFAAANLVLALSAPRVRPTAEQLAEAVAV
jgi:hypothetical protein